MTVQGKVVESEESDNVDDDEEEDEYNEDDEIIGNLYLK